MRKNNKVLLDLNNGAFQKCLFKLGKIEAVRVINSLAKIQQLDWGELYKDQGLKWEKITSIKAPEGMDAIYSFRITQAVRATALRVGDYLVLLTIQQNHDSTYAKK